MTRFSLIVLLGFFASFVACKKQPTEPGGTTGTTPASVGDSVPGFSSTYTYDKYQLDQNGDQVLGTKLSNYHGQVEVTDTTVFGRNHAYLVHFQGDSTFFVYESNGDVSVYFFKSGFHVNFSNGSFSDELVKGMQNNVYNQWIRFPIASSKVDTGIVIHNKQDTIEVTSLRKPIDVTATVGYFGDSTITVGTKSLVAKHCMIRMNGVLHSGSDRAKALHQFDFWFVPKIGYIAKQIARSFVPKYDLLVVPLDTTATMNVLTSYILH
ncbi:MAG: hypothetical protein WCH46_03765 [bacterium]